MKSARTKGVIFLPLIIVLIIVGALVLSFIFYSLFQRLNVQVENTLRDQFNQQQLMLAKKIADNVEAYFDYLENELMAFPWRFRNFKVDSTEFAAYMDRRFQDMNALGVMAILHYDENGVLVKSWSGQPPETSKAVRLPEAELDWVKQPQNRGRLYLGKVNRREQYPCSECLVMVMLTGLYASQDATQPNGALELLIDPLFIAGRSTQGVRSGLTGYAWIIDQNGVFLAHYEGDFVGHDAIKIRIARNPQLTYQGIKDLHERIFRGEEGTGTYVSGWHRQKIGQMEKLYAFTTIRFDKGLIRGITDVQDAAHNLWGVAVVAPVEEVSGHVWEVLYQELILAAMFFMVVILTSAALIGVALTFNKRLSREVELKTRELKESNEQLIRSERFAAVGEAAAYVSHEIKNPLMVIGGLAQQVGRRLEQPELREKLNIIQAEVRRLEDFLGDLRDFTRPTQPAKENINLNEVIQEVHRLMEGEAQKRNIIISEHLDPHLPKLEADPGQMKQVLLNLIKNSLEAMDSGGEITLNSGVDGRYVWFSVKDTGVGMTPEVQEKVFNPFFTTKEKGTGLGLAVIHKIIVDHQGSVALESKPEKGTTITVKLPRR
ncbi:MAG: ATP-binding protein [Deltaproteobacteria bacterium]|nr:ATP-binding protein [Deltaproteobacteria bacterium]